MPQTRDIALEELAADGSALPVTETRVDAAHSIGDAVPSLAEMRLGETPLADIALADMPVEQAITELMRVDDAVQLQSQADQLAAHLRQRQDELDRRESQINARVADFEQEVRDAKTWLAQRNDELNEREARLDVREATLRRREEVGQPRPKEENLAKTPHTVPPRVQPPLRLSSPDVASDARHNDEPELTKPQAGPSSFEERQWAAEWEERKEAMARAREQLDQRQRALEEFRDEISQMHREALELHLVTEELQARLRSSHGIDLVDDALETLREKVARRYHSDAAELIRRREELEWVKSDLAREHAKLERRYEELKGWVQSQQT